MYNTVDVLLEGFPQGIIEKAQCFVHFIYVKSGEELWFDNDDDKRTAFSLICCRDNCQRSSPLRVSDTPRAGFETKQSLSSRLVE